MGAQEQRNKSQATAEFMKKKGIRRTTGQCPWGCGAGYSIDREGALLNHLNQCEGGAAAKRRRAAGGRRARSRS